MPPLPSRMLLRALAWIQIVAGAVLHPVVYIFLVLHRLDPHRGYDTGYMLPLDIFEMVIGSLGWIAGGVSLLLILEIGTMLKKHLSLDKEK